MREESDSAAVALKWVGVWCAATALLAYLGWVSGAPWWVPVALSVPALLASVRRWFSAWLRQRHEVRRDALYRATGQAAVDAMAGVDFEHYVAAVLRGAGFTVEVTRATGDFGVDLIAVRDGVRTAVQCKRQSRAVSGAAIQQVVAGAAVHDCTATMVVTNHSYTRAAAQLAEVHGCVLVDRVRLARLARLRGARAVLRNSDPPRSAVAPAELAQ
ncbi:restriction endonuclease [Mycolicibacterium sp.]|uniref:restriction endonuclease n=1 Tax=Mycolicibacterium sp. TaxID=2320850 RepID=UPI001D68C11E|nr:restriction endonuclease [Mycolicibacterium sp.]MCB1290426.1 restriction endonuclease [Mycobacterium sp.]MCB9408003.1 restriction endonuclease [Mycolicibacterium sp.]